MDRGQFGDVHTCAAANGARSYFAIIRFLGYNPLFTAKTLAGQLVRQRMTLGLSQKEAAREIGLDQGTLAKWGRGEREPTGAFLGRVKSSLD